MATWQMEFKPSWREAGPPNDHDDIVDSDHYIVNKELSLSAIHNTKGQERSARYTQSHERSPVHTKEES